MPEGRTRGENSTPLSDTGGVAQQPLLLTHLFTPSTLSVRRRRRRRSLSPYPHGFTLALARASPAVKHGAPPPEAGFYEDHAYYLEEEILPLQV